jgi:hypothetical protein
MNCFPIPRDHPLTTPAQTHATIRPECALPTPYATPESDKPRPIFINRYRRTDDFVIIGGTTTANRAEAEKRAAAAEEAKKANSDRGLMLRGFRPFEA